MESREQIYKEALEAIINRDMLWSLDGLRSGDSGEIAKKALKDAEEIKT